MVKEKKRESAAEVLRRTAVQLRKEALLARSGVDIVEFHKLSLAEQSRFFMAAEMAENEHFIKLGELAEMAIQVEKEATQNLTELKKYETLDTELENPFYCDN